MSRFRFTEADIDVVSECVSQSTGTVVYRQTGISVDRANALLDAHIATLPSVSITKAWNGWSTLYWNKIHPSTVETATLFNLEPVRKEEPEKEVEWIK